MKKESIFTTTKMVQLAVLTAIIILMAFTPLGYFKMAALDITLLVIPVAVGAVVLGPVCGAILGFVFGMTSFVQMFTSPMGMVMLDINPVFCVITSIGARVLCGGLTGVCYNLYKKVRILNKFSYVLGSLTCPILNTIFFVGFLMLFYGNTPLIIDMQEALGVSNPLMFVAAIVGINGVVEAISCAIIGSAIIKALHIVLKMR